MITPLEARPKITNLDIQRGYTKRYFTQFVSTKKIYEIDKPQYDYFVSDPLYTTIQLSWIITSGAETIYKNIQIINYYNKKMIGLNRKLREPAEYMI